MMMIHEMSWCPRCIRNVAKNRFCSNLVVAQRSIDIVRISIARFGKMLIFIELSAAIIYRADRKRSEDITLFYRSIDMR